MKIELEYSWFADTEKKIIFRELSIVKKILIFFGCAQTEIVILYSMGVRGVHNNNQLTKFGPVIEHDNFLKPEKYPFYYKLNGGWKIKKGHEKYLKNGPLFSEDGTKVIVAEAISWKDRWWGVLFGWLLGIFSGLVVNYIYDFLK